MANKIKNKYSGPRATEFDTKDLVVDVKNGRLYYKSNYAVYEIKGSIFSTFTDVLDESFSLGNSTDGQVIFNSTGTFGGLDSFTITAADGTVNITTANIDGGPFDNISSLTAAADLDIGEFKLTVKNLAIDSFPSERVIFTSDGGNLSTSADLQFKNTGELRTPFIRLDDFASSTDIETFSEFTDSKVYLSKAAALPELVIKNQEGDIFIGSNNNTAKFDTNESTFLFAEPVKILGSHSTTSLAGFSISSTSLNTGGVTTGMGGVRRDFIITTGGMSWTQSTNAGAIRIRNMQNVNAPTTFDFNSADIQAANLIELKGNVKVLSQGNNQVGLLRSSNDVIAFASDKRLKENIIKISNPLEKINQLRGVYFDWNKKSEEEGFMVRRKKNEIGMIAQEVEEVIPQAIEIAPFDDDYKEKERENYKTIKYDRLIPLLVECIKEQQKQINNLQKQINEK